MNSPDVSDTPVFDQVSTENMPGAVLGTGPWPNQEPVVDGIDDAPQNADFIKNDRLMM